MAEIEVQTAELSSSITEGSVESQHEVCAQSEPAGSVEGQEAGSVEGQDKGSVEDQEAGSVEHEDRVQSEPAGSALSVDTSSAQGQHAAAVQQKQQPPLCRFFSQGRYCQFGRRCRFLHQRPEVQRYERNRNPRERFETTDTSGGAEMSAPHSKNEARSIPSKTYTNSGNKRYQNRRLCRYFASGYCSMDANCRFWHPEKVPPVRDDHSVRNKPIPKEKVPVVHDDPSMSKQPIPKEKDPPVPDDPSESKQPILKEKDPPECDDSMARTKPIPKEVPPEHDDPSVRTKPIPKEKVPLEHDDPSVRTKPIPKEKVPLEHDDPSVWTKPIPKEKVPPEHADTPVRTKPILREKVERPLAVPEVIQASNVTPEVAAQLRKTEISQLLKRFPKDKVIIQEREDGKVTYYRIAVEPTDPDWPFDLKELEMLLEFPEDYPLEVFTIQIPEDQVLPSVMGRHVCEASQAWLQGKHATNQLIGKVELLFRPFLRWLDRNMERLFTEGARLLKRDMDVEKAGLQFVTYQQLQAAMADKCGEEVTAGDGELEENPSDEDLEDDDSESWVSCEEEDDDEPGTADGMKSVEASGDTGPRKGTEIRFLELRLGEGVGTLKAQCIVVCLRCSRCNVTADLSLSGKQPCAAQCEKCNSRISGTFLPSILHQYSPVLGYVDIQGAAAKELVLRECTFMIGCLNCSHEEPIQNLSFGLTKDLNCLICHSKLSVSTEAVRFQKVQRFPSKAVGNRDQRGSGRKKLRDPAIQSGKPLPDHGTCRHFRKSCRWLRFPCCGKAYPCDGCHDEAESHVMEMATRMLCGYCAKEQPYTNGKACISCGNMMNKNLQSIHWEGGRGCRNKIKMSRKDKQKYSNSSKTLSRKSVSKK